MVGLDSFNTNNIIMEFTKEERHKIYTIALELFVNDRSIDVGMCYYLRKAVQIIHGISNSKLEQDTMLMFPEVLKHKPKNAGVYWFKLDVDPNSKSNVKRLKILKAVINKTKPNL